MKIRKYNENIQNLDFGLTDEQKVKITEMMEKLMEKYQSKFSEDRVYFNGIVDGINHCYKLINGIKDDYLDDVV